MNKFNKYVAEATLAMINTIEVNTKREVSTPLQVILYDLISYSPRTNVTFRVDGDSFYLANTKKNMEVTMNRHGRVDYTYNAEGHTGSFHLGMK